MRRSRAVRRALLVSLVLLGVGAGVAAGYGYGKVEKSRYRAEGSLVVERGTQPLSGAGSQGLVVTIRDLAESAAVSQAVIANLALHESLATYHERVHVAIDGISPVLSIRADAESSGRAKSIVQQLGLVITQTVHLRFGQSPLGGEPVQVAVLDEPHELAGRVSPSVRHDLGWGALFGLVAGLLLANLVAMRRPPRIEVEAPRLLGEVGSDSGFDALARTLAGITRERPFQTVVLAGDDDARVAIGLGSALGDLGESAAWVLAADADSAELEALAARSAFVLVAAPELDARLASHADAVVAVTDGSPPPTALVLGLHGTRLLGTVVLRRDREAE